jgi:hypothetical protein
LIHYRLATFLFFGSVAAVPLASASAQQPAPPLPEPVDTGYVTYDDGPISLPLGIGFRLPSYDRVNGLSLPWGPKIETRNERVRIDPIVTYRSHLGEFDPSIKVRLASPGGFAVDFSGGRGTFTNDRWIRSDLTNSASAFAVGSDARNYFRADRAVLEVSQIVAADSTQFRFGIGAQTENDWSTGSRAPVSSSPWSVFGRTDDLKMRRPNPAIWRGHVTSALGRFEVAYAKDEVVAELRSVVERTADVRLDEPTLASGFFSLPPFPPPILVRNTDDFTQITIAAKAGFPTFGTQRFDFRGHAVATPGTDAPPQRYAYLGGGGTLATVDQLALGGDRLLYAEGEYSIPLDSLLLPFVGSPTFLVRYAAGSAGIGRLPDLIQNISLGVRFKLLKLQYHFDPNYRKTAFSKKQKVSVGVSLPAI